jgi:N-acetylmuramic acid 6-phosphate etherase
MSGMRLFAGIDGGGTKIRLAIADEGGRLLAHREGPGANAAVDGPDVAGRRIAALLAPVLRGRQVTGLVVGVAGGWSPAVANSMARSIRGSIRVRHCEVLNDAITSLRAYAPDAASMLLSVGTGVVLVGLDPRRPGRLIRVDGWGPLAGDEGSGHWIGRRAVQRALAGHDGRGPASPFTRAVLAALHLRDPGRDIHRLYAQPRPQATVAGLAPLVIRHARRGDAIARSILRSASGLLGHTVETGLRRMPAGRIRLFCAGGLAAGAPELLAGVRDIARTRSGRLALERAVIVPEAAALRLAVRAVGGIPLEQAMDPAIRRVAASRPRTMRGAIVTRGLSVTEQANPDTMDFSRRSRLGMVQAMNREDARVAPAIRAILPAVARAVTLAESALRRGGRLIYVGAGTSGRLGVLDASEAPPTFGVSPRTVVGIIAGGHRALARGIEGAEDRADQGAAAIRRERVTSRDCVVGLSVSGGAPYVLAAVRAARARGASTVGITCNPGSRLARSVRVALVPRVGPEAIAGSSRLKAGTAQKMLLNMLSTAAFARIGRIEGNVMIRVTPVNVKLRLRATRIVAATLGIAEREARRRLERAGWRMDRVLSLARGAHDAGVQLVHVPGRRGVG